MNPSRAFIGLVVYAVSSALGGSALAQSVPSGNVTFSQTGPSSVPETAQSIFQQTISVYDKMTPAQISDAQSCSYGYDDAPSIQAALNSLPARGGNVTIPPGCYRLDETVTIGNGGSSASSVNGIRLVGQGIAWGLSGITGAPGGGQLPVVFRLSSTASAAVTINGPIQGCGISNIDFEFASTVGPVARAIVDQGCSYGLFENLVVNQPSDYGIIETTTALGPADHNVWRNIYVRLAGTSSGSAQGIVISGNASGGDRFFDRWDTVRVVMSQSGQTAIHFQYCDSTILTSVEIPGIGGASSGSAILYDYSLVANFPNDTVIQGLDPYTNGISNAGTAPPGTTFTNRIYGLLQGNGATVPTLPNFLVINN